MISKLTCSFMSTKSTCTQCLMHATFIISGHLCCALVLSNVLQVTGGLQLQLSQACSTLHFSVPSKVGVCRPGTLGIYFETTVDMSFNVTYMVDGQLWNDLAPK